MKNLLTHPQEIGNTVYCIKDGISRGKGEHYYKGKSYIVSHWYGGGLSCDNFGIKGFTNIVDKVNFSPEKPEEIINNYQIF